MRLSANKLSWELLGSALSNDVTPVTSHQTVESMVLGVTGRQGQFYGFGCQPQDRGFNEKSVHGTRDTELGSG
jgi:hypothetical protein